jgi:diguanylate cyclase (GGDEF)-like protein
MAKKILVIEDEELVRANLIDLLEMEQFEAIAAEDGYIGVQLAQEQGPDLILCDVSMPELDGFAVLEQLRRNPKTAGIPLIFLTARATQADLRQGMRLGADDYLTKPFSQAELLEAIETRLVKHEAITQPYLQALKQATTAPINQFNYDPITYLPTRLLLQETFNQIRANQTTIPILSLKIDRFDDLCSPLRDVEENYLLQSIVQRLLCCLDAQDVLARMSDDQFAILLTAVNDRSAIHATCQRILTSLVQPLRLNRQDLFLTASIGILLYPEHGTELNNLMRKANVVMREAQRQGGNQYRFYAFERSNHQTERLALENKLRHALENREFEVYYQPQINLQTGKVIGAEALLRWNHTERGMILPAEFIPLAEEIGLICPIGEWVLQTACQQTQALRQAGFPRLRVAVNLSVQQFCQPQLVQTVAQILQQTNLDSLALELELTETTLLQNEVNAIATLNKLKALGIHIAIDDFGTGYASLSYLKQFPFDVIKIDRYFIRNVHSESYNNAITTAVLQMANQLNLNVVAEGVETEAELAFLQAHCCHTMQGFLFSRPLTALQYEALLIEGRCLAGNGLGYYSKNSCN